MKKIEIENGALLIDMGAGTTEYVLTHNSGVLHSGVLTVGGEHLVNDLSLGLDLAQNVCRKILNEGEYLAHRERGDTFISIDGLIDQNTRKIPLNSFDKIIDLRLKETFSIIKREITDRQMLSKINTGLIFTGGVAELPQAREILQSVFEMPARIGKPEDISGAVTDLENPRYSTIWGLLKYGDRIRQGNETGGKTNFIDLLDNFSSNVLNKFSSILKSIKF